MADEITIVAADLNDPDPEGQVRGMFRKSEDIRYARVKVSAVEVQAHLIEFMNTMDRVVTELPPQVGGFALDSVTLAVEVSAKGTVSLLGTGGELAGKGGLTFTLKRSSSSGQ
jgi:hypothetical protein